MSLCSPSLFPLLIVFLLFWRTSRFSSALCECVFVQFTVRVRVLIPFRLFCASGFCFRVSLERLWIKHCWESVTWIERYHQHSPEKNPQLVLQSRRRELYSLSKSLCKCDSQLVASRDRSGDGVRVLLLYWGFLMIVY